MTDVILRPDYKAGDAEFDDDVRIMNTGHARIFSETNALVALELIARFAGAAQRQAVYWRHQAETMPTPEQIFADEAWCKSVGYVKV